VRAAVDWGGGGGGQEPNGDVDWRSTDTCDRYGEPVRRRLLVRSDLICSKMLAALEEFSSWGAHRQSGTGPKNPEVHRRLPE
jgi:hypothetical protein